MSNIDFSNCKSQKEAVLHVLNEQGYITSNDAIYGFRATRLSAIIWDLRHKDNIRIRSQRCKGKNIFGHPYTYAKYTLIKEDK